MPPLLLPNEDAGDAACTAFLGFRSLLAICCTPESANDVLGFGSMLRVLLLGSLEGFEVLLAILLLELREPLHACIDVCA